MALLYCPQFIAFDENGDPVSGALLYTYDSVSTSTPKATYSDAARTVAHTNPVVANASGVFPQMYGDEGDGYYCVLKNASDVTLDEFQAVQMLGQDASSVFLRDFALNGRMQAYGEAGVVNLEFMPPDGDDTGGDGRIGGAEGTQGAALEVDFADISITGDVVITGALEAHGLTEPFARVTTSGSFSAATEVLIPLGQTFDMWEVSLYVTSVSDRVFAQLSYDDGDTYKSGSSDYVIGGDYAVSSTPTAQSAGNLTSARLTPNTALNITAGALTLNVRVRSKTGQYATIHSSFRAMDSTGPSSVVGEMDALVASTAYGKATHIRVFVTSGSLTGDYRVVGVP